MLDMYECLGRLDLRDIAAGTAYRAHGVSFTIIPLPPLLCP